MKPEPPPRDAAPRADTLHLDDTHVGDSMREALAQVLQDLDGEAGPATPPSVPDHTLVERIGQGAYGDVWLARNTLGTARAVKVVRRARFREDRPYEREFHGILKYEPISRTHEGLVQILHVGRADGCFYYIMELADAHPEAPTASSERAGARAAARSPAAAPATYEPHTLRSELAGRVRLPPREAALLVQQLTGALSHLHRQGLIHRDIKPSNVIFVGGRPKLADIGLVTDAGGSQSFVGTEGFIPPEGPGTPQADLYALGKLLYELATGRDRLEFPQLPPLPDTTARRRIPGAENATDANRRSGPPGELESLLELNEVITRACAPDPRQRYASATELEADLNLFLAGRSLRQTRLLERTMRRLRNAVAVACGFLAIAALAIGYVKREARHATERARLATERAGIESASRVQEAALRARAEEAEGLARRQLHAALLEQARATIRGGELGHRVQALDALRRAAAISNSAELRREVLAAITLPDLRFERSLPIPAQDTEPRLDPAFERVAVSRGRGPVEIRAATDNHLIASLPASTNLPVYVRRWSQDGRFLAIKRDHPDGGVTADWEVWDVTAERRVLLLRDIHRDAFTFHPRLARCLASLRDGGSVVWDLATGGEIARHPDLHRPFAIHYSPEGDRLAMVGIRSGGWVITILDARDPAQPELAASSILQEYPVAEWHPGGQWLALADRGNAVSGMDAATGETVLLGRHKNSAARVQFSPDGNWLFSGGWGQELICWDARTRRRAFGIDLDSHLIQIRADSRACAVVTRTHLQFHALERPAAHREFAEDLGGLLSQATFSADGRWLAASAARCLGVWDLAGNGPGAVAREGANSRVYFTADAGELFATRNPEHPPSAFRWRLVPATNHATPPVLTRLPLPHPRGFTSLGLGSNVVTFTSTNGTRLLTPADLASKGGGNASLADAPLVRTAAGVSVASPDGRWLGIYRSFGTTLNLYRLPDLQGAARLALSGSFGSLQFSPLGDELAIGSLRDPSRVELWSTTTWERTRTLTNFGRMLYAPDGRGWWLSQGLRSAGLYDPATLAPLLLLPTGTLPLAISPDGRHLAVSVDGLRLQLWDLVAVREELARLGLDWSKP